tara:strand:- start:99 stop:806 length:708 start_codon:yes stop_codon:yes gene_type:complete
MNVQDGVYTEKGTNYPYGRNGGAIFINDGNGNFTYEDFKLADVDELVGYDSEDQDQYRDNWVGQGLDIAIGLCPIDFGGNYGTGFVFDFSYENEAVNNEGGIDYQSNMFATVRKVNELDVEDSTLYKAMQHIEVSIEANNNGSGNVYKIDGLQNRPLTGDQSLKRKKSYKFVHSSDHPLRFSETPDGTHGGGTEYTTGVTTSSGETVIQFNDSTPSTLYYYCDIHAGMGAEITVE